MSLLLSDGAAASASAVLSAFEEIRSSGQAVLDQLYDTRASSLHLFERQVLTLHLLRQRLAKAPVVHQACWFGLTDLSAVNQPETNATVACGSGLATLQQKQETPAVTVEQVSFSTSAGIFQPIGNLFQVYSGGGDRPTATLDVRLSALIDLSSVQFTLLLPPGESQVEVLASANGISYQSAASVAFSGRKVYAVFAPVEARYLRVVCQAQFPDATGGNTYTFGLSGLTPSFTSYYPESQLVSRALPVGAQSCYLKAFYQEDPRIEVYLSFDGSTYFNLANEQRITIPGGYYRYDPAVLPATMNSSGLVTFPDPAGSLTGFPAYTVLSSVNVRLAADALSLPVYQGVDPASLTSLAAQSPLATIWNNQLYCLPANAALPLAVSYYVVPPASCTFRVFLKSDSSAETPLFSGVSLLDWFVGL